MRTLYHFANSPFSRRARLALTHKGLEAELRDARETPSYMDEVRRLNPACTAPLLVEEDGRAVADSTAMAHYLDAAYPDRPRLWPAAAEAARASLEVTGLVDFALNTIVDVGTRYFVLNGAPAWKGVVDERMGRAQRAIDVLAKHAASAGPGPLLAGEGWCVADIWLFAMVAWLERLPERAASSANVAQILTLPWSLPAPLPRWAEAHRARADVAALG